MMLSYELLENLLSFSMSLDAVLFERVRGPTGVPCHEMSKRESEHSEQIFSQTESDWTCFSSFPMRFHIYLLTQNTGKTFHQEVSGKP